MIRIERSSVTYILETTQTNFITSLKRYFFQKIIYCVCSYSKAKVQYQYIIPIYNTIYTISKQIEHGLFQKKIQTGGKGVDDMEFSRVYIEEHVEIPGVN